ncbi:MFS family permease [Hymenobacter luteus]|uniref:MFS family permease n=2 Tax=Hymenobacter TaxID=89966 RepID=A0A7W9T1K7_9BACT|nr:MULTISPECIES: MFS transporter [Hymenobacter]MBB4601661.1 MFS family permease [Hymenobacter latericoloratus]MBB6059911.1 MFS family permease [Hymenobacter luteus]
MAESTPTQRRVAVSTLFFVAGLCFASWASRIPDIGLKLGLSEGELGQLLLALPVGSMLALPVAGWLVHTYGSRQVVLLATCLYAGFLPLLGWATGFWTLAGSLVLFGFAGNLLNISVNTQAIGVQAAYGQPIMASFHGLWSLAGFLGGALGTLLIRWQQTPFRHFLLVMGVGLVLAVLAHQRTLPQDVGAAGGSSGLRRPEPYLLRVGLIAFCGMLCEGCMFDWSGVYFQKVVRPDATLVTAGYVACMSTMALGRFISDFFTHRFGTARMLQISSALIAAGLLTAVVWPAFGPSVTGFLLVGFGIASVTPLAYSAAGQSATVSPGVALAMVSSIGYLGFLLGPPLIGLVAEVSSLRVSFGLVAGLGAAIGVLAARATPAPTSSQPLPMQDVGAASAH